MQGTWVGLVPRIHPAIVLSIPKGSRTLDRHKVLGYQEAFSTGHIHLQQVFSQTKSWHSCGLHIKLLSSQLHRSPGRVYPSARLCQESVDARVLAHVSCQICETCFHAIVVQPSLIHCKAVCTLMTIHASWTAIVSPWFHLYSAPTVCMCTRVHVCKRALWWCERTSIFIRISMWLCVWINMGMCVNMYIYRTCVFMDIKMYGRGEYV